MTTAFLAIQALSILAMALDVYATLNKSDKKLIRLHALGSFLFSIHYLLLGAIPGALSELLNATRTGLSSFTKSKILAYIFIGIYTVLLFIVPENLIQAGPFICGIIITVALYFFEGIKLRILYIIGFSMWLLYSLDVMSWGGIALFSTMIVTSCITIYRILQDQKS